MDDCHQVSPRTGKPLEATQGTRKVPRLREKRCQLSSDVFVFFLSRALWHCHSSKPNRGIFKEKKTTCQLLKPGKNIAKGRPLCWPKIESLLLCFPGFVGCFFPSMTQFYPLGLTRDTFDSRSLFNLRFLIVYIRIMPRECGSWRRTMRRKIPWGDD